MCVAQPLAFPNAVHEVCAGKPTTAAVQASTREAKQFTTAPDSDDERSEWAAEELEAEDVETIQRLVGAHAKHTGSKRAEAVLADWDAHASKFVKVMWLRRGS